jgi:hypothetical protein
MMTGARRPYHSFTDLVIQTAYTIFNDRMYIIDEMGRKLLWP